MRNAKHQLEWCKARRHCTLEQWKRVLWSDELRFTICQSGWQENATVPVPMHSANCKVVMVWGCFSWGLGPLVPVKGNQHYSIQWHSRRFCASNFVATVWGRAFPVSAWQCPCAESEVHTEIVCRDRCGRTWLACTEPWLQPHRIYLA